MTERYLTLLRIGTDPKGNERGILKVMQGASMVTAFSTREYGGTLTYSSLRVGQYEMEHSMKTHNLDGTPSSNPKKCLRPTDSRIRSILIHAAYSDEPGTLLGCIAPGIMGAIDQFTDSQMAMQKLLEALDGYEEGKIVVLKVLSNATGVMPLFETKDTWHRTR